MAIDTLQKRLACLAGALPPPDGAIDGGDRAIFLDLFVFEEAPPPDQPLPAPDVMVDFHVAARASVAATVESPTRSPATVAARASAAFDVEIGS